MRDDERDLIREAEEYGFGSKPKKSWPRPPRGTGLFANGGVRDRAAGTVPFRDDGRSPPPLGGRKKGFFLMVEGSLIDSRAHDNLWKKPWTRL